jgi:hypothetical protein
MKNEEIKISKIYAIKVGKNTVGVRIMSEHKDGGWVGSNIKTNKELIIRSADRFIGLYEAKNDKAKSSKPSKKEKQFSPKPENVKPSKQGGLTIAAQILQEAGQPLNCQEMVKQMLEKGLWKTDGKTPAATIYSAIIREIKEKGPQSRFRKTERGKFEFAK